MKKLAVFAVAAVLAASAFAQNAHWMGDSLMVVNSQWYNGSKSVEGWQNFNGNDYSSLTSLILGGEIQTWGESDSEPSAVEMNVKFDGVDDGTLTGSLPYLRNEGQNKLFQNEEAINVPLAQFRDGESHTMSVYFSKATTDTTADNYSAETGKLYGAGGDLTATFTAAVPEPATMSLLGLGALAMVLRRKLRK
jgi:hypothetical protein